MHRIAICTYLLALFLTTGANAQVRYLKAIGGPGEEEAKRIIQAPDGDYVVVGYVNSTTVNHGASSFKDALVFKISPQGVLRWAWAIGGNKEEEFRDIVFYQGYYYCVGFTNTYMRNNSTGVERDILLVKLELDGDVVWSKHFGEPTTASLFNDVGVAIEATPSSGVVLLGVTGSGVSTESDVVAINVLPDGTVGFAKKYDTANIAGQSPDNAYDVTSDGSGNYFVSCGIYGITTGVGDIDGMMMKLSSTGDITWARRMRLGNTVEICESTVYNANNNRLYSAGVNNLTTTNSDPILWTLRADNGQIGTTPPPKLRRYDSPTERRRMLLYPRKTSGFYGTLYANTGDQAQLAAMDAVVFSLDESLSSPITPWQKTFGLGAEYDYISHLVNCTDTEDIIGVGGTRSAWIGTGQVLNFDVFIARLSPSGGVPLVPSCVGNSTYPVDTLASSNLDNTANVTATDLITGWVNNDTIKLPASINAMSYLITRDSCPALSGGSSLVMSQNELSAFQSFSSSIAVEECLAVSCLKNLKFNFPSNALSYSFLIYDDLGYEYFETNKKIRLIEGFKYSDLNLKPGRYHWKLTAPLASGFVEHYYGQIKIQ